MPVKAAETAKINKAAAAPAKQPEAASAEQAQQYGESGTAVSLIRLQRMHGNRFVQCVTQAKIEVSQPGDPYEREADEVADRIMTMPAAEAQPVPQRATIPDEEKEKQNLPAQPVPSKTNSLMPVRQPLPLEKDEEKSGQGKAFRAAEPDAPNAVLPNAEAAVAAASNSTGQQLPANLQRKFEQALGVDLSAVRIHAREETESRLLSFPGNRAVQRFSGFEHEQLGNAAVANIDLGHGVVLTWGAGSGARGR